MEQVKLEQFLDTGWMNGADLFYNGRIYRTDYCYNDDENKYLASVYSWHAVKNSETTYIDALTPEEEGECTLVYEHSEPTEDKARIALLSAPIFEGKTFWDLVDEIKWLKRT